jgi:hypothetical protein
MSRDDWWEWREASDQDHVVRCAWLVQRTASLTALSTTVIIGALASVVSLATLGCVSPIAWSLLASTGLAAAIASLIVFTLSPRRAHGVALVLSGIAFVLGILALEIVVRLAGVLGRLVLRLHDRTRQRTSIPRARVVRHLVR